MKKLLKTLYIMDSLKKIDVKGDSTYMMMLEANKRGWETYYCDSKDLFVENGVAYAKMNHVLVTKEDPYFSSFPEENHRLDGFDVVWMRKDPPFNMDYIFTTYILDLIPKTTLVLNNPSSIRRCNEKIFAMEWPEFCPKTLLTRHIIRAMEWATSFEKVVIKPWDGNGGRGVLVTEKDDPNFRSMLEILTENEDQYILVQQYIPEIKEGDKRIILINGEVVGQMTRVPGQGDHRGNMHVGASVQACELTERDLAICAAIAPKLRELGLLFVGIDIIGDYLTEINVTSPTGIQEINRLMDIQVEKILTDKIVEHYNML